MNLQPFAEQGKVGVEGYLDALWTYMIGLAWAGIDSPTDKPTGAEVGESDSTKYVFIPLDVVLAYHA